MLNENPVRVCIPSPSSTCRRRARFLRRLDPTSADAQLAAQAALQASGAAFVPERSLYVVIRDLSRRPVHPDDWALATGSQRGRHDRKRPCSSATSFR